MWRNPRLLLLLLVFVAAAATGAAESVPNGWRAILLICAITFPLFFLLPPFICFMQYLIRPGERDACWQRPSLSISPFARRKPLHPYFYAGLMALSIGLGLLLQPLLTGRTIAPSILILFTAPTATLLGCLLSLKIFEHQFVPRNRR